MCESQILSGRGFGGLNLFYREESVLSFISNETKGFPVDVQLCSRGVQLLISKETYSTCDFPGGGGGEVGDGGLNFCSPPPPLDLLMTLSTY